MASNDSVAPPRWSFYTEPKYVEVEGIRTAYRRKGTGEKVLYLHGDGFTRAWLPFYDELAASVELVVPEHPGYGDTPINDTLQSFEDFVLHYDSLLRALALEPVHLVGHDIGGWLAADLAVFYPQRFKSLTLITPTGLRQQDTPSIDVFRMTAEERLDAQFNGRSEHYADYVEQEGQPDDMIRRMVESATAGRLMWNPRYDHRLDHRLNRVLAPTLVIGAQEDRMVPTSMAADFAYLIPAAQLTTAKGQRGQRSGHLPHIEDPVGISTLVARHVALNS